MKNVSVIILLLALTVSTARAQECPAPGAMPGPGESVFTANKLRASAGNLAILAANGLSSDQQIVCIAGDSQTQVQHLNADNPFYSSTEELWLGNAWINNSRLENEYDDDDRLTSKVFLRWNTGLQEFVDETATSYTYGANGNSTDIVSASWNGTAFVNQTRSYFERDALGNQTRIERFDWENGAWKTRFLSVSTVVNGLIAETLIQTTHAQGVLANALRQTFEYDADGRETLELEESWDENAQSWTLSARELTSYTSTTAVTMSQVYQGGSWQDFIELTIVYDSQGNEVEWTSVGQMTNVGGNRFLYTYNSAGHLTELVSQGDDGMGNWINQSRQTLTLDTDGDPLELLIQQHDGTAWVNLSRSTFNYTDSPAATGVEDEMIPGLTAFDVYPYPAKDRVNVALQLTEASDVHLEVFDTLGRRVVNLSQGMAPAGTQRISWSAQNEPAGLYFMRLTVDGAVDTRPVVLIK